MARRSRSATTNPASPGLQDQPPPVAAGGLVDDGPAIITSMAGRARRTSRMLVLVPPNSGGDAARVLLDRAGLRMQTADASGVATPPEDGALLMERLGVAVVTADTDQLLALSAAVSDRHVLLAAPEPEYVLYTAERGAEWLRGYRDAVDHIAARMLESDTSMPVSGAGAGGTSALAGTSAATWGVLATRVPESRLTGAGVRVAVLDTGIDQLHPDLRGGPEPALMSFVPGESVQDGNGHGTHCAGVACFGGTPSATSTRYGVASGAELFVGKVLDTMGEGRTQWILQGIEWAIRSGCRVVSMSLSGQAPPSPIFEQVGQRALTQGTLLLAAAGNDSNRPARLMPVGYPANCDSILAVAALDRALRVARFSNVGGSAGDRIDIAAPGVGVMSAWPGTRLYRQESGTSMATPFAAGVAALLAEANPGISAARLGELLLESAHALPGLRPQDVGVGLVQAPL